MMLKVRLILQKMIQLSPCVKTVRVNSNFQDHFIIRKLGRSSVRREIWYVWYVSYPVLRIGSFHKSHMLSITGSHVFTKMFVICAEKMYDLMKEHQQHDVVLWGAVSSHDIFALSFSRHASPTDQLHSIRVSSLTVYEQVNTRNLFHSLYSEGSRQTIFSSERRAHLIKWVSWSSS